MAQPVESSDFLASPHRSTSDRNPWVAPVEYLGATEMLARPAPPAEVAQARLFEGILQAEIAELHQRAYHMGGSLYRQSDVDNHEPCRDLLRIHERMDEVHRLLQALRGRFPQPRWEAELQPE
jgi:hypothetical protein